MAKAEYLNITNKIDANLLADIRRHRELWEEWDRIVIDEGRENDPRIPALSDETTKLAISIVATPAHTLEAYEGKMRISELEALESWDDLGLIKVILKIDADRISSA